MAFKLEVRPNLRPYEGVILVNPDASEDEQKTLFKKNKSIIEEQFGGSVKTLETWGKRKVSNAIEKTKAAVFFHTTFEANPQAIAELERTMRINDKVLRFMHTRLDDGTNLDTHMENFKKALGESAARERERRIHSHLCPQRQWYRGVLGRQQRRAARCGEWHIHADRRRSQAYVWREERRNGRLLGRQLFRSVDSSERHIYAGQRGDVSYLRREDRRNHRVLGTQRLGTSDAPCGHVHAGQRRCAS